MVNTNLSSKVRKPPVKWTLITGYLANPSLFLYHTPMNKRVLRADLLLLLTAAIWGFGFVAQRYGMEYVGPFTFNGVRFILGSLSLLPLILWRNRGKKKIAGERKNMFLASILAGTCLFFAVTLQQLGLMTTTAGNAGFITGLYVIFTPIFGIFLGKKTGSPTWLGAALTFTGLYFISSTGRLSDLNPGDIIVAISAMFWAFHVLIIDRLVQKNNPVTLACGQFAVAGLLALAAAFLIEPLLSLWLGSLNLNPNLHLSGLFTWYSLPALINGLSSGTIPLTLVSNALVPILYGGLISVGIGFTLQAIAQRDAPPAHATIILCLEGSFAALGGILLLNEPLGTRTIIGFALMLMGMLISQWELISSKTRSLQ